MKIEYSSSSLYASITVYILNLIYKEILYTLGFAFGINDTLQLTWSLDRLIASFLQVNENNTVTRSTRGDKFIRYRMHKTGFSTATNTCNNFYHTGIMIKASDLIQIVFSFIELHRILSMQE